MKTHTATITHTLLFFIEPIAPNYKLRIRCSCGWKHMSDSSEGEYWWTPAKAFAAGAAGAFDDLNGTSQKDKILNYYKGEHLVADLAINDAIYEDAIEMAKLIE